MSMDELNKKLKDYVKGQRMRWFFKFSPLYVDFLQHAEIIKIIDKSTSKKFEDWDMYLQYKEKEYIFCFREDEGFTDETWLLEEGEMYHFWDLLHYVERGEG